MNRYAIRLAAFTIGLLCAVPGWGATGSAAADTWYARPAAPPSARWSTAAAMPAARRFL